MRCNRTVAVVTPRALAMTLFLCPRHTCIRTSVSRWVRWQDSRMAWIAKATVATGPGEFEQGLLECGHLAFSRFRCWDSGGCHADGWVWSDWSRAPRMCCTGKTEPPVAACVGSRAGTWGGARAGGPLATSAPSALAAVWTSVDCGGRSSPSRPLGRCSFRHFPRFLEKFGLARASGTWRRAVRLARGMLTKRPG